MCWCSHLRAIMAAIVSDDPVFGSCEVKMPLWRHLPQLPERLQGEIPGNSQQQHAAHRFPHSELTGEHQDQIPLTVSEAAAARTWAQKCARSS